MKKFMKPWLALLLVVAMVLPSVAGIASAATKPSSDVIAEIPAGASVFFQSENEAYSFNTATYWDVYQTQLGVPKGSTAVSSSHVNYGLTLASSTDAALVSGTYTSSGTYSSKAITAALTSSTWGSFSADRYIEIPDVYLDAGANSIKIAMSPLGADLYTLSICDASGNVIESLTPASDNVNATKTEQNDSQCITCTATNTANGYIDVGTGAQCKNTGSLYCIGYMDNHSVTYHFAGTSADNITAGYYTLRLQYAGTNTSSNVTVSVNEPITTGGTLRIDYESAWTYTYAQYPGDGAQTVFNYTDGTGTAVGWGGNVTEAFGRDPQMDRLVISLKVVNGADLETLDDYMKIYLVKADGTPVYQTTLANMSPASFSANGEGKGYSDFQNDFNPGYVTYVSANTADIDLAEGMKILFEAPSGQPDISGTIEIAYVGLNTGTWANNDYDSFMNKAYWTSFGPFDYDDAVIHPYTEINKALGYTVKPFLRQPGATTNQSCSSDGKYAGYSKAGAGEGTKVSGSNISSNNWHLWTMSTSDANIVDANYADKNGTGTYNALEIKYQKNSAHETTASLTRASTDVRTGQWLAITIKGEDLILDGIQDQDIDKINLILNKGSTTDNAQEITVSLGDFRTAPSDSADKVDMDQLNKGYQTLYYHVGAADGQTDDYNLYSVDFDFSQVSAAAGNDAHRIYVKEIYLYSPTLVIEKSASLDIAHAGQTVEYRLNVYNETNTQINGVTVKDVLPEGVTYNNNSVQYYCTVNGQELTWSNLSVPAYGNINIVFTVNMPTDAENGDMVTNIATAMHSDKTVTSNSVTTVIEEPTTPEVPVSPVSEFTFYAEVGQETYLPLGQATVSTTTTATGTAFSTSYTSGTLTTTNWVGNGDTTWETCTISGVTFGKGANTVTFNKLASDLKSVTITDSTGTTYTISPSATNVDGLLNFNDGNGSAYSFTGNKSTDDYISVDSTTDYGPRLNTSPVGYIGYSDNGNLTYHFNNSAIAQGVGSITFEYTTQNSGVTASVTVAGTTYTSTTQNVTGNVKTVYEYSDNAWVGTDGNLYYKQPNTAGKETFDLLYTVEGAGDTQYTASVTVYNFDVTDHLYVLDFGLPVSLTGDSDTTTESIASFAELGDMLVSQGAGGSAGMTASFKGIIAQESKKNTDGVADVDTDYNGNNYGTMSGDVVNAEYNGKITIAENAAYSFTYEPTHFMDSDDIFYYGVQVTVDGTTAALDATNSTPVMEGQIKVIPASQVYYEDNFASSGTGADGDNGIIFDEGTSQSGTSQTGSTQSNELGLQYGYDPEYADDPMYSDGSATKLPGGAWAMFRFKGTGFDVVSRTATDTGTIMAFIYRASTVTIDKDKGILVPADANVKFVAPIAVVSVDTYYENNGTTGLYQIPVISWTSANNDYDEYVVRIAVSNTKVGEETLARPVEIDGIRIYNPGGTEAEQVAGVYEEYTKENNGIPDETNLVYKELRALVLGENFVYDQDEPENSTGYDPKAALVKYTDQNNILPGVTVTENFSSAYFKGQGHNNQAQNTADMLAYAVQGPNNELYLSEAYGVALKVSSGTQVQVGVKAVSGAPVVQYLNSSAGWNTLATLNTATEMYYTIDLSDCYNNIILLRVKDDGNSETNAIASFTNLKVDKNATISIPTDVDVKDIETADQDAANKDLLEGNNGFSVIDGPGPNNRRTITFVTKADVVDVQVFFGDQEADTVTASYTFTDAGTKTWVIRAQTPDGQSGNEYKVYVVSNDGYRYEVPAATN